MLLEWKNWDLPEVLNKEFNFYHFFEVELAYIIMVYGWKMYKGNRAQNQDHPTEIFFLSLSRTQMSLFSSLFFNNSIQSWLSKSSRSSWFTLLSSICFAIQFSFTLYMIKNTPTYFFYIPQSFLYSFHVHSALAPSWSYSFLLCHTHFLSIPFPLHFTSFHVFSWHT